MQVKPKKKHPILRKLYDKYRLVLMNDDTYEEKLSFSLTRFNVFLAFGVLSIFLIVATIYLIAFTPLREYIPGYGDFDTRRVLRHLSQRTDSLERIVQQKDLYILNIRNIVEGREIVEEMPDTLLNPLGYLLDRLPRSPEDSILRAEMQAYTVLSPTAESIGFSINASSRISQAFFFPPVKGMITSYFDPVLGHFGVDLVAGPNETIKATLDGSVIFSGWTLETGYTLVLQHANNLVSVYKHNSVVFKQEGSQVRAGDPIAIIGNTGTLSSGTHLHFELWFNGSPVNPSDYIVF
ncbi:MAG TPA: M23 family metallopeptidase [Bacteroidales bacterium]|nr:M23 family metallopeptidase [Bacteroidales bacterium]